MCGALPVTGDSSTACANDSSMWVIGSVPEYTYQKSPSKIFFSRLLSLWLFISQFKIVHFVDQNVSFEDQYFFP